MVNGTLKQAHLAGQLKGLRHSQQRRLERISHTRHPKNEGADVVTLERLAQAVQDLHQPLHMLLDNRGLCRLLWVGPLNTSKQLLEHLPESQRRKGNLWRLISCLYKPDRDGTAPDPQDALVALDLYPVSWLRFSHKKDAGGSSQATLWQPNHCESSGWSLVDKQILSDICESSKITTIQPVVNSPLKDESNQRVMLLTIETSDQKQNNRELSELEGLVRSAGGITVSIASQQKRGHAPHTIWGTGKLKETALEIRRHRASLVVADRELTPTQVRNLEKLLKCPVMDRSELILDIFAQRASSAAGRLQVELAQLRYQLPRLLGRGKSLSRQGGGIGTRGPGETQLEKDRRAITIRIEHLTKELKRLKRHRNLLRNRRNSLYRIALVGYTNAGKSSLLNSLCGLNVRNQVLTENKLFATLDPTTRRLIIPQEGQTPKELLITDTVGFIRELPSPLFEAFRATLEETLEADLLLLVVDLSNPDWEKHLQTVNNLLDSLGVNSLRKVVANQIDRCENSSLEAIRLIEPEALYISATSGAGIQGLKRSLLETFWGQEVKSPSG